MTLSSYPSANGLVYYIICGYQNGLLLVYDITDSGKFDLRAEIKAHKNKK